MTAPQYITLTNASKMFALSLKTLRRLFDDGTISGYRTEGGHRRISLESMRQFVERDDAFVLDVLHRMGLR
ncbi:uncharacterized protein Dvar_36020 [Desulfosarcina variabilis str. Montpellier]|uniref:excisionase family DNA-binding protein n=1 Tax=Desulfosarcina variabilis TaxID=2300 RepID=UPI003AFA26B9